MTHSGENDAFDTLTALRDVPVRDEDGHVAAARQAILDELPAAEASWTAPSSADMEVPAYPLAGLTSTGQGPGRGLARAGTAAVLVLVVVLIGLGVRMNRASDAGGTATDGPATSVAPAQQPQSRATLSGPDGPTIPPVLRQIYESGWLPYDGEDVLHPERGSSSDLQGYLHYGENVELGKSPIYDVPNGTIIGFAYSQLGFVSLADDPTFDAHAARVARFGCDAVVDPTCKPRGFEPPG